MCTQFDCKTQDVLPQTARETSEGQSAGLMPHISAPPHHLASPESKSIDGVF